jgi:poly(beta-D-mannuronate) lyase
MTKNFILHSFGIQDLSGLLYILNLLNKTISSNFIALCLTLFSLNHLIAEDFLVSTQLEYEDRVKNVKPGDTIILKDGVWSNFEILFVGQGSKDKPITLRSQTNGNVLITGESNLRIAGEHLVVSGLIFKNGFTPTSSVIEFRQNKLLLANHSRVTQVVIDNFNNPERTENDSWVTIYGKHNRFDSNHLEGKKNKGVTLAVKLNTLESQENYHIIENNYFGPRQILGSNGGETLRIGTSHFSLSKSHTLVKNNFFDRCDGELEIVSNKSGNNKFIGNIFFESRGTLTMRHGNDTAVEENIFLGNNQDHTGGIRVINKRQLIKNNYMEGLKGYRFGGALVVMNGVPNSSINRYHQVEDSIIQNNSIINSDHIHFASGSDQERSAVPKNSEFKNNLIYQQNNKDPFKVFDDISGIKFTNNLINKISNFQFNDGFNSASFDYVRLANNLLYPKDTLIKEGVSRSLNPITKDKVGVQWYPKPSIEDTFDSGNIIEVKPGDNNIFNALKLTKSGDILLLAPGEYTVNKILQINKSITIKSKAKNTKIFFERGNLFEIKNGGNLKLSGLQISGSESPDSAGNSVIRTHKSILDNYQLIVENCSIYDLNINHSFDFINPSKGSFANSITIKNSEFTNISGSVLLLNKEYEDYGIYNAEYVSISDSIFKDIGGSLVSLYRGGTDESTFGPHFNLTNSTLTNVGHGSRNKSKSSILLHGVQVTNIEKNKLLKSPGIKIAHTVGEPITKVFDNQFIGTERINIKELNSSKINTAFLQNNIYQYSN